MVYSPPSNPDFNKIYTDHSDGDPATGPYLNVRQAEIADNIKVLSNAHYNTIKTLIFDYIKNFGTTELELLSGLPLTLAAADWFNYAGTTLVPGDFLIVVNSSNEIAYDYMLMITDVGTAVPKNYIYEEFAGTPGPYSQVYLFRVASAYESRYFNAFTQSMGDILADIKAVILDVGGRLRFLDESYLASSMGINVNGTKSNFTTSNFISPGDSYYNAIESLDKAFDFISDIKANLIAKIGYTGTHPRILPSLNSFGSTFTTLITSLYSVTGLITGNMIAGVPSFTYPSTDNAAITIAGSTCSNIAIKAEPGVIINGTITVTVNKVLKEVLVEGLVFGESGKLVINSTFDIDRIIVRNCKSKPSGNRTDYWLEINMGSAAFGECIVAGIKSDTDDSISSAFEGWGIKISSDDVTADGILMLLNNTLVGRCYFKSKIIRGYGNVIKCGDVGTTLDYPIQFVGNTKLGGNKFYMGNGYDITLSINRTLVFIDTSGIPTNANIYAAQNEFINEAVLTQFPALLETNADSSCFKNIVENLFQSLSTNSPTFSIPAITIGNYYGLKFNDNIIDIGNNLSYAHESNLVYINCSSGTRSAELNKNTFYVDAASTCVGGAGANNAGLGPGWTEGEYAAIIGIEDPGNGIRANNNTFIFRSRGNYVRLIDIWGTPAAGLVFVEDNKYQVLTGADFVYEYDAGNPGLIEDDWIYPQQKYMDDGIVILTAGVTGVRSGDVNWQTWRAAADKVVLLDCGVYWDGGLNIVIKKEGTYLVSFVVTDDDLSNEDRVEADVVVTSGTIMGISSFTKITGAFAGNPYAVTHFDVVLSGSNMLHFLNGDGFKLSIIGDIHANADTATLSLRRIN
jgi:hypothetical protein